MSSVGETLRRERLRTGLDLERIAQDTKISVRTLELIEGDHFEKLPGGVFARSFVRQYARAVGVDEEEIVGEVDKAQTAKAPEVVTAAPTSSPETPRPAPVPSQTPAQSVSGTVTADASSGALHIALTAEEPTWVRATASGKVVFSGVIQPNETK